MIRTRTGPDSDSCFILTWWKQEVTAASTLQLATPNSCTATGTLAHTYKCTLRGWGREERHAGKC